MQPLVIKIMRIIIQSLMFFTVRTTTLNLYYYVKYFENTVDIFNSYCFIKLIVS